MLRILRLLWTGRWSLPEWEVIETGKLLERRSGGKPCVGHYYILRERVSGEIRYTSNIWG